MLDLRRTLKSVGAAGLLKQSTSISARELARQRFRFAGRLLRAAGHAGWVVLFDEVELIGRYSVLQRGRSYAELARRLGNDAADPGTPLLAVLAMTDDFEAAVLTGKDDLVQIPAKLRAKQSPEWDETAALAEAGMRHIEHDMVLLEPPDDDDLDRAYAALRQLHADAFGWSPDVAYRAARRYPDAAVRAGLDQRVGPRPARPGFPPGEPGRCSERLPRGRHPRRRIQQLKARRGPVAPGMAMGYRGGPALLRAGRSCGPPGHPTRVLY